ncbi:MAG: SDR family oxidoreductase [candidate division KSB1 bacterium]|nr:SDR family oxidoreductase [candidate division KSB1 bacterium]
MGNLFDLSGKIALVTGASRGIGRAVAVGLAEHGADVVLVARSQEGLERVAVEIQAHGRRAWVKPWDLERVAEIGSFYQSVVQDTGGVDILVNVAGIQRRAMALDLSLADWQDVLTVNLTSVFVLCQAFARERIASGKPGCIVNIGSLMCEGHRPTTVAYTASKGGIRQLTKALAVEWARYGIRVNAVAPGYIATEMTKPLQENPELDTWVRTRAPMGRWGEPREIVGPVVFLASEASSYVTGHILYADGGWLANL